MRHGTPSYAEAALNAAGRLTGIFFVCVSRAGALYGVPTEVIPKVTVRVGRQTPEPSSSIGDALQRARRLRATHPGQPITISLSRGVIRLSQPLVLTAIDSGTPEAPLLITGASDGRTTISGSTIAASGGRGTRIIASAAGAKVSGYTLDGNIGRTMPTLFEGGRALAVTRWPRHGYAKDWSFERRAQELVLSSRTYSGRPNGPVLVAGYLDHDWSYRLIRVNQVGYTFPIIDLGREIKVVPELRLRLFNVPLEPEAGQFWFDEAKHKLRVHLFGTGAPLEVASTETLLKIQGASNINIAALAFEKVSGDAITISDSRNVTLSDCFVGLAAGNGITVLGGSDVTVMRCVIRYTGKGGVILSGGDRSTLTPTRHTVIDSVIEDFGTELRSYSPGVKLSGVGNEVHRTLLRSAPHSAVLLSGNENLVNENEISHVLCETGDAGVIYMGRDWTQRGNRIVGNFIHDIPALTSNSIDAAIYLDDQFSGAEIRDNTILRVPTGIVIGGGQDNLISNNIFAALKHSALFLDSRGTDWQRAMAKPGGELRTMLDRSPYLSTIWMQRYPLLSTLVKRHPGGPEGNLATNNIVLGAPLIRTVPDHLPLPGTGNRELLARPSDATIFQSDDPQQQFKLLAMRLRGSQAISIPGPREHLLYSNRMALTATCPVD